MHLVAIGDGCLGSRQNGLAVAVEAGRRILDDAGTVPVDDDRPAVEAGPDRPAGGELAQVRGQGEGQDVAERRHAVVWFQDPRDVDGVHVGDGFLDDRHNPLDSRGEIGRGGEGEFVGAHSVVTNVFMRLGAEWDGYKAEPDLVISDGDQVAARTWYSGTGKRTGRSFRARFVHWYTRPRSTATGAECT